MWRFIVLEGDESHPLPLFYVVVIIMIYEVVK